MSETNSRIVIFIIGIAAGAFAAGVFDIAVLVLRAAVCQQ